MPIVRKRGQGEVAGQEGEGEAGHGDEQDQRRGVDGLGQVEAAEPVDVAGDPPALGDRLRQARELVLEQDDVGDALGHLAAGAHRHRHPRPLQRRHVVDAVADHRRVAARVRSARDQRLLLLGLDPAEDGVAPAPPRPAPRDPRAARGPRSPRRPSGTPTAVRDRGDGRPGVAGDQLQVDLLVAHQLDRLGGVGAQVLLQHDQRQRAQPRRRLRSRGLAGSGSLVSPKATTRRPAAVSLSQLAPPGRRAASGRPALASTSGAPST